MKLLAVGNSFSEDACAYLHDAAQSAGIKLDTYNLYIGGCSLERHAENWRNNRPDYLLETNGQSTGRMISIKEAIEAFGPFDAVTIQQASHFSGKPETYFPHAQILYDAVKECGRVWMHETWAYEIDSTHGAFPDYGSDQTQMFCRLRAAYREAAEKLGVPLIPVGDVIQRFRETVPAFDYAHGGLSLCRDGFHLSIPAGRYLAALVWLEALTGCDARKVSYLPDGLDPELGRLIREEVHAALAEDRRI